MSLQFVFAAKKTNFPKQQRLPSLFTESFYNGTPWVYLIHNRGTKHKVWIKPVNSMGNNYKLYGEEWSEFVKDSRYTNVDVLHFIRQEEDTYYVTAYDDVGYECGGYNCMEIGTRQMRCCIRMGENIGNSTLLPGDFLQDIVSNEYDLKVGGMFLATVRHRRVHIRGTANPKQYGNMFYGDGWNTFVESQHLEPGKKIVFTNVGGNSVALISFATNGLGLGFENIPRTPLNEALPICRGPLEKDKRMFHICDWEGHDQHKNEDACFYTSMVAYVFDRNRLTVPAKYVDKTELFTYDSAIVRHGGLEFQVDLEIQRHKRKRIRKIRNNHVTMIAHEKWKNINMQCRFTKDKMIRFKLVDFITDLEETLDPDFPVLIPVFDMC